MGLREVFNPTESLEKVVLVRVANFSLVETKRLPGESNAFLMTIQNLLSGDCMEVGMSIEDMHHIHEAISITLTKFPHLLESKP